MGKITNVANAVKDLLVELTKSGEDYNDSEIDKAVKDIEANETKGRRIGLEMEMRKSKSNKCKRCKKKI